MGLRDRARAGADAAKSRADLLRWKSGYHEHKGPLAGLSPKEISEIYARRERELLAEERQRKLDEAKVTIERDRQKRLGKARGKVPREEQSAAKAARDLTKAQGTQAQATSARVQAEETLRRARRGTDTAAIEKADKALTQAQRAERRARDGVTSAQRASQRAEQRLNDARNAVTKIEREKR